jgi:hypothetical protein
MGGKFSISHRGKKRKNKGTTIINNTNENNNKGTTIINNTNENNNKGTTTINSTDENNNKGMRIPKVKLKYKKTLPEEIKSINSISNFPSKKFLLTVNDDELYYLDETFNILTQAEEAEKNISIKDDNLFLTYGNRTISIWEIINMENIIQLNKKDVIKFNDDYLMQVSFNIDIIGLSCNDEFYRIIKYSKCKDNIYKEDSSIISKEQIYYFLIFKNSGNNLIAVCQQSYLKIYQINTKNFQLNTSIKIWENSSDMKLFSYGKNGLVLVLKHNSSITYRGPLDTLTLYDKRTMKKIFYNWFNWSFTDGENCIFYKQKIFCHFSRYMGVIKAHEIIEKNETMNESYINLRSSKFIKLNEDEICAYVNVGRNGVLCIYEFE